MGVPASRCITASGCTLGLLLLGGCAQTQLGAQYTDPQFPPQALHGATVLVVCDAPEPAIRLICESQISGQLAQLGARPLTDATLVNPTPGREPPPSQYLPAAKAAGARAVFTTTLEPDSARVDKWFRRNCKDVLSRECTPAEKSDVIAFLLSLKP